MHFFNPDPGFKNNAVQILHLHCVGDTTVQLWYVVVSHPLSAYMIHRQLVEQVVLSYSYQCSRFDNWEIREI